ncbi:MAG: c-type cytochrome, partial [Castellaniella sp.]
MDNTVIGHDERMGRTMERGKAIGIALVLALCGANARASGGTAVDGMALAGQRQCLGCHQVDARRVGPPFRAIAERFQG